MPVSRPDYGIDAPGVVRNLLGIGAVLLAASLLLPSVSPGLSRPARSALWCGGSLFVTGLLMVLYAKAGKYRHRDRMLAMVPWNGSERVLDVGTGRGLLAIGAAKRLSTGSAIGIDVFSAKDLSGNSAEATLLNAELEGVAARVEIKEEDARRMSFPDASFDVVLSNLCLHNIEEAEGRRQACVEIARVLRPGGIALVSDFVKTAEYVRAFRGAGLAAERSGPYLLDTFPPLRVVKAAKKG